MLGDGPSSLRSILLWRQNATAKAIPLASRNFSRLISRLRHRQIGILVAASYLALQAYQEIMEDGHPVIVISARDIANPLEKAGLGDLVELQKWLSLFLIFEQPNAVECLFCAQHQKCQIGLCTCELGLRTKILDIKIRDWRLEAQLAVWCRTRLVFRSRGPTNPPVRGGHVACFPKMRKWLTERALAG